ncbi:hypothetical protein V1477_013261 [Vespula maculifrons]|uniref:Uncharacterized protein n=1 Tax=Vespula maculifrons TaxID=7453 RepID=A0ABD2BVF4_VESMC
MEALERVVDTRSQRYNSQYVGRTKSEFSLKVKSRFSLDVSQVKGRLMSGMKREQTFTSLCLERLSALVIVIEDPRRRESPSASYEHYTGEFELCYKTFIYLHITTTPKDIYTAEKISNS